MPPLNLPKKLTPVRKAWKSFTNKLQSKVQNLHVTKSIKATTRRLLEFCSLHLFAPFKKRFLSNSSYVRHRYYNNLYQYRNQDQLYNYKNLKAVYIDQLYGEAVSVQAKKVYAEGESSRSKEIADDHKGLKRKEKGGVIGKSIYSVDDAWNAVVATSPHLRGVDERAEEFIYKVREEMKLEKEKSLLDFQEMLARGA